MLVLPLELLLREREECLLSGRQVDDISGLGELVGNVLSGFDLTQFDETLAGFSERLGHQRRGLRVTFS